MDLNTNLKYKTEYNTIKAKQLRKYYLCIGIARLVTSDTLSRTIKFIADSSSVRQDTAKAIESIIIFCTLNNFQKVSCFCNVFFSACT
jgi:hypothetical protein